MSYRQVLSQRTIAISTSESPDMLVLGLSDAHLRDATAEIARHLLALGSRLAYGGDLRVNGFSNLLFELVARHRRDADEGDDRLAVTNYLAWPVHIQMEFADIQKFSADLAGLADLICVSKDGEPMTLEERQRQAQYLPSEEDWTTGLTNMRILMRRATYARIVLGGRVDRYKGSMPGIAEEALLSLQARQPLFLMGGFGGCARDVAETLGIITPWVGSRADWPGRSSFMSYVVNDLNNGLTAEENATLARTPHVDQAVTLILMGLLRLNAVVPPES